ncbi:cytochrome P450 family protein [Actinokineospora bangkokensis]|uniref:hypothetical protein n=1 Tax=Actinokineospora bangkokensis TaxID=1193682 RepID=UPI000A527CD5|nr:hypothetical protein [Actinokineospora bangkokensis]
MDESLSVLTRGYAWLPDRLRAEGAPVLRTRLMGKRATCIHGVEAARFFYDEANVHRHGALPGPVKSTLFGHGAVHTLDGAAHRGRKHLFTSLLMNHHGIADLVARVERTWDGVAGVWTPGQPVTLFDEAARILTAAVFGWIGLPLRPEDIAPTAHDLAAMVDGFATPSPRHFQARAARARQEKRLGGVVKAIRDGSTQVPADSAVHAIAHHRDADGALLSPRVAAVEILNVVRPTVAIAYFATFAAHALHQ